MPSAALMHNINAWPSGLTQGVVQYRVQSTNLEMKHIASTPINMHSVASRLWGKPGRSSGLHSQLWDATFECCAESSILGVDGNLRMNSVATEYRSILFGR